MLVRIAFDRSNPDMKKIPATAEAVTGILVGVSLKDLAKPSKINGLQAASKVLLF